LLPQHVENGNYQKEMYLIDGVAQKLKCRVGVSRGDTKAP
jgi:hypothetical protein